MGAVELPVGKNHCGLPLVAQWQRTCLPMQETRVPLRCFPGPYPTFPGGSDGKVSAYNAGDLGSIPGSGRSPGEGNGNPLLLGKSHGWRSLVGYSPWGRKESDTTEQLHFIPPYPIPWGFPGSSAGKESACNAGDPGSIPGSGRSPGEGIGYPLQYSWASLLAQMVRNLPAMQETWV